MRLEGNIGLYINRDIDVSFEFEGKEYVGFQGDTIASALIANDELILSRSFKYHRPRGVLTMSGHDANSLVQIEDEPNVRADRHEISSGLKIGAQNFYGSLKKDRAAIINYLSRFLPVGFYYKAFFRPKGIWNLWDVLIRNFAGLGKINTKAKPYLSDKEYKFCDVAIIGAGPAGLSAAVEAARSGAEVILIDENKELGGSLNFARFDIDRNQSNLIRSKLIQEINEFENITIYKNAICSGWFADNYLTVMCNNRMLKIRSERVIAATGLLEQPIVFRNNDLPGVMLCSALQRLIYLFGVIPGKIGLIVTTCDDGYATALDLIDANIEVAAIIDLRTNPLNSKFVQAIKDKNVKIYTSFCIEEAIPNSSTGSLKGARIKPITNQTEKNKSIEIDCEFIGVCGGYSPAAQLICHSGGVLNYNQELASFKINESNQNNSSYTAGSLNNFYKLDDVINDGRYAANCCLSNLGFNTQDLIKQPINEIAESSNYAAPIQPHPKGKDFIDFDEDLQVKDIINAIKEGYDDLELVKRYSTVVMGPSQGRHSALNNLRLVCDTTNTPLDGVSITTQRPPYYPEYIQHLAGESFQPVKHSTIQDRHVALKARFIPAGQWLRPAYYQTTSSKLDCIESENLAIRNNVGLIDVSTLGKIEICGSDAAEFLNRMYTFSYKKQQIGKSRYVLMTDKTGSIIDDGVACRLSEEQFYVTTTSSGADNVYRTMLFWNSQWNLDLCITNVTSAYASINLAGPKSRDVLQDIIDDIDLSNDSFPYMDIQQGHISNIPARIIRVGFVGELGYEIHVPSTFGEALWDILIEAGKSLNIQAVGVEAQRLLRLEKGHIIVGQDSDGLTNPHEVNMSWAIAKNKPFFIGKRAIDVINSNGSKKRLVGFTIETKSTVPEESNLIISNNEIIGRITSVAYSPTLKMIIGLALVSPSHSEIKTDLSIKLSNGEFINAKVCAIPFYDPDNERQNC